MNKDTYGRGEGTIFLVLFCFVFVGLGEWGDNSGGRGKSKWKGHETGAYSLCSRNSMEASGAAKMSKG